MRLLFSLAFFLSGAAGLIYELVWTRYLTLLVGAGAYAQILVIGVYLSGLAAGALIVGSLARRIARPILWYVAAEVALALAGGAFHSIYAWAASGAYQEVLAGLPVGALWVARLAVATALILPQSILLGMTFPLMVGGVVRRFPDRAGGAVASLYAVNAVGGAAGVLLTGFVLIGFFGLPGTLWCAAALNVAAAGVALAARRGSAVPAALTADSSGTPVSALPWGGTRLWWCLLLVASLSAMASLSYEVVWIRMLSLLLGSATHAFELILSAFVLGLGVGAFLSRRSVDQTPEPLGLLGAVQWAMGLAAVLSLPLYLASFDAAGRMVDQLQVSPGGYATYNTLRYALALTIMLPTTALAGVTLPLIITTLLRSGAGERAVGWAYGLNTVGSVGGVVLAGLVLLSAWGLKATLMIAGAANVVIGLGLLVLAKRVGERWPVGWTRGAAACAVLVLGVIGLSVRPDGVSLTAGVFRYGRNQPQAGGELLYYRDGRTATVSVVRPRFDDLVTLTTNGKPDASLSTRWIRSAGERLDPEPIRHQDEATQALSPLVLLAHASGARRAAVVGHGSGISGHVLLGSPTLESVVTIEIEPVILKASRHFYPANRRVFEHPASVIVIDDARSFLAYQREQYDLILSEPSNPWVRGNASLFTIEFYERVQASLTEGGVFGQWFQLYEVDDRLVTTVLAAIHRSFGDYAGYLVGDSDLLIVATPADRLQAPDWSVVESPGVSRDLQHVHPLTPDALESLRLFDRELLEPLLDGYGVVNSDFAPVLDLGAERTLFFDEVAAGLQGLATDRVDLYRALGERAATLGPFRPLALPGLAPARERALGLWLRESGSGEDPSPFERPLADRVDIYRTFMRGLEAEGPPEDWLRWARGLQRVDHDLHAGLPGVADPWFFGRVRSYLDGLAPPEDVSLLVDLLEGLTVFDFQVMARTVDLLLREDVEGGLWLERTLLLDAAVVSYLKTGRPRDALDVLDSLGPRVGRRPDDFRLLLMRAQAERAVSEAEG